MAYATFGPTSAPHPHIEPSPVESRAFGIRVGRLDYGMGTDWDSVDLTRDLTAGDADLVIMRYPADRLAITRDLAASGLRSLSADMLIYYRWVIASGGATEGITWDRLTGTDRARSENLVSSIFHGYQNHYLANPVTSGIDIVAAYQEWTTTSLDRPSVQVLAMSTSDDLDAGLCMVERIADEVELQLVGLHPSVRGQGRYLLLLRSLAERLAGEGVTSIVSSTQAWNIPALRTWTKVGFLPELALTTVHVMPREPRSPITRLR